jgi:hypothetical protein
MRLSHETILYLNDPSEKQKNNSENTKTKYLCLNYSAGCNIACVISECKCKAVQVAIPLGELIKNGGNI